MRSTSGPNSTTRSTPHDHVHGSNAVRSVVQQRTLDLVVSIKPLLSSWVSGWTRVGLCARLVRTHMAVADIAWSRSSFGVAPSVASSQHVRASLEGAQSLATTQTTTTTINHTHQKHTPRRMQGQPRTTGDALSHTPIQMLAHHNADR